MEKTAVADNYVKTYGSLNNNSCNCETGAAGTFKVNENSEMQWKWKGGGKKLHSPQTRHGSNTKQTESLKNKMRMFLNTIRFKELENQNHDGINLHIRHFWPIHIGLIHSKHDIYKLFVFLKKLGYTLS